MSYLFTNVKNVQVDLKYLLCTELCPLQYSYEEVIPLSVATFGIGLIKLE
jgi:hypothetical protein